MVIRGLAGGLRSEGAGELQQRPDPEPGAALHLVTCHFVGRDRPRDVEMHPRHIARELLQEQSRDQGSTEAARTDVLQIGDLGIELLAVLLRRRLPAP